MPVCLPHLCLPSPSPKVAAARPSYARPTFATLGMKSPPHHSTTPLLSNRECSNNKEEPQCPTHSGYPVTVPPQHAHTTAPPARQRPERYWLGQRWRVPRAPSQTPQPTQWSEACLLLPFPHPPPQSFPSYALCLKT